MIFKYDRRSTILDRLDFDPEKVISKIEECAEYISERINVPISIERSHIIENDIKPSDLYCSLNITFTSDIIRLNGTIQILIPEIKGFTVIKGIKRFVQNQIRDLLFIIKPKSCRIISEYPAFTMYESKTGNIFSIEGNPVYALPLYFALAAKSEQGVNITKLEELEVNQELLDVLLAIDKEEDYFRVMSQVKNTSINRSKYLYELLLAMYNSSNILKEFFKEPSDIILSMFEKLKFKDKDSDTEIGLNIENRRLRTVEEIITYNLCWELITKVLYNRFIISKQRRNLNCTIDPFRGIYDFVLTETMFHSPLATLSNKFRVVLTGQGGFTKDNVPLRLKDIHPSQYRNICPVVTPDREKAGIVLYLAYCAEVDEIGRFKIHKLESFEGLGEI